MVPTPRHGEGTLVQVISRRQTQTDGTGALSLELDLGSAPVPERKYSADVATFVEVSHEYRMVFGQTKLKGSGLRSMIEVRLSKEAVNHLGGTLSDMVRTLTAFLETNGVPRGELFDFNEEPAQTVGFTANIVAIGFAAREATMDFFLASSFVWDHVVRHGQNMALEPIVRVSLPSRVLLELLKAVRGAMSSPPAGGRT